MYGHFCGNIGRDAELKMVQGRQAMQQLTVFSVADTIGWGENAKTLWIKCNFWGQRGEKLSQYLKKGQKVVVRGEISLSEWQGTDGVARSGLECRVDDVQLVGAKQQNASTAPVGTTSTKQSVQGHSASQQTEITFDDDDIPF